MKRVAIVLLMLLLILGACSKSGGYEGEHGTYDLIRAHIEENSPILRQDLAKIYLVLKYKNNTKESKIPGESALLDLVLEQGTQSGLEEVKLESSTYVGTFTDELAWLEENREWKESGNEETAPGKSVEFVLEGIVEKETINLLFLRDKSDIQNGENYEEKVSDYLAD